MRVLPIAASIVLFVGPSADAGWLDVKDSETKAAAQAWSDCMTEQTARRIAQNVKRTGKKGRFSAAFSESEAECDKVKAMALVRKKSGEDIGFQGFYGALWSQVRKQTRAHYETIDAPQ